MRITGLALLLLTCFNTAQAAPVPACASPTQAVREQGYVPINGIAQWITVTGAACGNPVILFIHGGPGNALSPYADAIYAGWERHYTLVQWDQRGAGMTYAKQQPTEDMTLTVEQMRDDGIAVARYIEQHLGQQKVILMGSSWGSILGVHMAKARPDLFHAYIGTAQVVNARDNETGMYREVMALAQAAGDTATVDKLTALGAPPWTDPRNFGILRRFDRKYEGLATDPPPKHWWQPAPFYATPQALADAEAADDYSYIQFIGLRGDGMFAKVDLPALGTRFDLPVFFIMGEADLLTSPVIARTYFDSITAPAKGFTVVKRAGHDPNQAVHDAQWTVLRDKVAPLLQR
ncbi:alpha/beta fold hydrolase [Janthinobacterium sp. NKUCC06_STL]|uniref:alpha/beta fold hydrolase n=1 Tax=Janthinobacterium sp. NKUCC06_STL TaxID=2842127 RepID=UPI001C5AC625|nr:alpha/beta hydrolase [Janthinobacterium sp. NKUCC06_STL]MBW3509453.1 alpha/beta hydrolase [Janthinobacterium sp. NKUCC06_STL]